MTIPPLGKGEVENMATKYVLRVYRLEEPVVVSKNNGRTFAGYKGKMNYVVLISCSIRNCWVHMTDNRRLLARNESDLIDLINFYGKNCTVRFMKNGFEDGVKVMGNAFTRIMWSSNVKHMGSINLMNRMVKDLELVNY